MREFNSELPTVLYKQGFDVTAATLEVRFSKFKANGKFDYLSPRNHEYVKISVRFRFWKFDRSSSHTIVYNMTEKFLHVARNGVAD